MKQIARYLTELQFSKKQLHDCDSAISLRDSALTVKDSIIIKYELESRIKDEIISNDSLIMAEQDGAIYTLEETIEKTDKKNKLKNLKSFGLGVVVGVLLYLVASL